MKLRHLQATAAVTLLCGSVLFGNTTSYTAIGKIVKAGEVKQTESDTTAQHGRVEKPVGEVYVPCEAKTEKNGIKAEVKPRETATALQNSVAKATEASKAKAAQESTVPTLNRGGSKAAQKDNSATQTLLASTKLKGSAMATAAATDNTTVASEQKKIDVAALSYDVSRFTLPADVRPLAIVEGPTVEGGKDTYRETKASDEPRWNKARVAALVKDEVGQWQAKIRSASIYGCGGMSATRHSGDGTIPIGLWETDTSFGRNASEEGSPDGYTHIQAKTKRRYQSDRTNRLESAAKATEQEGEKLREDWARNAYAYVLNTGFNKDNHQPGTGSALFLYCTSNGKPNTAGCVAIQPEAMKAMLHQYAKDGMYIAQASKGQSKQVYSALSESGTATKGELKASTKGLLATGTVMLR